MSEPSAARIMTQSATSIKPLDVAGVAARWGCSTTFVYQQLKAGHLGHFKLGAKLYRITPQDVEAYECQNHTA